MLKNRPFLKGLGWGLIAGAVLLQLMLLVRDASEGGAPGSGAAALPTELSAKLVKEKADELNLQVYDKNVKLFTEEQVNDTVAKAVEKAKAEAGTPPPADAAPAPAAEVSIYILEGMPAGNIMDLLTSSGIIADRAALEQAMNEGQLTARIRAGLYTFKKNDSIPDVLTKLTTVPKF